MTANTNLAKAAEIATVAQMFLDIAGTALASVFRMNDMLKRASANGDVLLSEEDRLALRQFRQSKLDSLNEALVAAEALGGGLAARPKDADEDAEDADEDAEDADEDADDLNNPNT